MTGPSHTLSLDGRRPLHSSTSLSDQETSFILTEVLETSSWGFFRRRNQSLMLYLGSERHIGDVRPSKTVTQRLLSRSMGREPEEVWNSLGFVPVTGLSKESSGIQLTSGDDNPIRYSQMPKRSHDGVAESGSGATPYPRSWLST